MTSTEILEKLKAGDPETKRHYRLYKETILDSKGHKITVEHALPKVRHGGGNPHPVGKPNTEGLLISTAFRISPTAKANLASVKARKTALLICTYIKGLRDCGIKPDKKYWRNRPQSTDEIIKLNITIPEYLVRYTENELKACNISYLVSDFLEFQLPVLMEKLGEHVYKATPKEFIDVLHPCNINE